VRYNVAVNIISTTIEDQSQNIERKYLINYFEVRYLVNCVKINCTIF